MVDYPPIANQPTNYGYGSAYDPHGTGSRAQPATVGETGAVPMFALPIGKNAVRPGLPPKVDDSKKAHVGG